MKVCVVGSGYVGLVTGACLGDVGNDVLFVDTDAAKIARLRAGELPIYEPGLEAIVHGPGPFHNSVPARAQPGWFPSSTTPSVTRIRGSARKRALKAVSRTLGEEDYGRLI